MLLWLLVVLVLFPFLLVLGFGVLSVGRLWVQDPECPKWLWLVCWIVIVVFWITDPAFNWIWAAVIFRQPGSWLRFTWRKLTFSSRINHYFEHPDDCPNFRKRNLWARLLNLGVAGHIDTHGEDISPAGA